MKVTTALFAATLTAFAVECGNGDAGMDEMETMEDEAGMMEEGMPEEMMDDTMEMSGPDGMSGGG